MRNNTDKNSPKTPGGISKSLLTPCRRVGLSRNWKKDGPSPFKSPFNTPDVSTTPVRSEPKKRKQPSNEFDNVETQPNTCDVAEVNSDIICKGESNAIVSTPIRNVEGPKRKSRTRVASNIIKSDCNSISVINSGSANESETCNVLSEEVHKSTESEDFKLKDLNQSNLNLDCVKLNKRRKTSTMNPQENLVNVNCVSPKGIEKEEVRCENNTGAHKEKSPKDLTKECIVVIQKKIFKVKSNDLEEIEDKYSKLIESNNSQVLFDSDSDDAPLSTLNNKHIKLNDNIENAAPIVHDDDDDFIEKSDMKKIEKHKENKLEKVPIQNSRNKVNKTRNLKQNKSDKKMLNERDSSQSSNPFDEDDDDFDNKRTILIRKTYDKVTKPSKAKSTGSITQKDIDDLRERTETKKKLLLAKAMTKETKELRELIKKWQKGCQDALIELMDLMKKKLPDKQYMQYSELLKMLNIPTDLVGYDSGDDCFNTPDDASIILSKFHNL